MKTLCHSEARQRLQAAANGHLENADQPALDAHLSACAKCRDYAAELTVVEDRLRHIFAQRWDGARGPQPDLARRLANPEEKPMSRNRLPNLASGLAVLLLISAITFTLQVQSRQPAVGPVQDDTPTPSGLPTHQIETPPISATMVPGPTFLPEPTPTLEPTRHIRPPYYVHEVQAEFPGLGTLAGYSIYDVNPVTLNLHTVWYASAWPAHDYYILAHLEDDAGRLWSQTSIPVYRYRPTSEWPAGEYAKADVWLDLPYDLPPGDYAFYVSVSEIDSGAAVPAAAGSLTGDGRVRLGTLRIMLSATMTPTPEGGAAEPPCQGANCTPTPVMCHGFCPGDHWLPLSPPTLTYTVAPDDTCQAIATAYAVTLEDLLTANGLNGCEAITVGQELTIPYDATDAPPICPVTVPPAPPYVPPAPHNALRVGAGRFWYGTADLWTKLEANGVWARLPYTGHGYTQKIFWWREGYDWLEEPNPALTVSSTRLDVPGDTFVQDWASNGFAGDTLSFMNAGPILPTAGCWEITGNYGERSLSFVVWVVP